MTLLYLMARLAAIVIVLLVIGAGLFIGRERLVRTRYEYRERFASVAPYAGLLGLVLVANKFARDIGPDLSLLIGISITGYLHRIDGLLLAPFFGEPHQVVVWLQSLATPELTAYFAFIYVYGYVFLLVFPLVAYFALSSPEPLRRTIVAYGANYVLGVACYIMFIAFGPRNLIIDYADGLLYSQYAQYQFVTTAVNDETNVFPSLHTSMAVTAALLAWTTRREYPLWVPVAAVLAVSVVIATMYLGIHWATDVVFGIALAWVSVRIGERYDDTEPNLGRMRKPFRTLRDRVLALAR